jgi:hypothetical protein
MACVPRVWVTEAHLVIVERRSWEVGKLDEHI